MVYSPKSLFIPLRQCLGREEWQRTRHDSDVWMPIRVCWHCPWKRPPILRGWELQNQVGQVYFQPCHWWSWYEVCCWPSLCGIPNHQPAVHWSEEQIYIHFLSLPDSSTRQGWSREPLFLRIYQVRFVRNEDHQEDGLWSNQNIRRGILLSKRQCYRRRWWLLHGFCLWLEDREDWVHHVGRQNNEWSSSCHRWDLDQSSKWIPFFLCSSKSASLIR